eukprot:COSAG04_NODE_991_length_8915_cov_4.477654_6_plen_111_part_00
MTRTPKDHAGPVPTQVGASFISAKRFPDQLATFQARIGALHTAQLLSDDELYALEDLIGDFCDLRESVEMARATPKHSLAMMGKLRKLAALAETFADDATLAWALRWGLE